MERWKKTDGLYKKVSKVVPLAQHSNIPLFHIKYIMFNRKQDYHL